MHRQIRYISGTWRPFLLGVVFLVASVSSSSAEIKFCNSGGIRIFLGTVLEDPNLRLFTSDPWVSNGFYRLDPNKCVSVSGGRSDGMRVHYLVAYYVANVLIYSQNKQTSDNTRVSNKLFCIDEKGWNYKGKSAVYCPGKKMKPFPKVLIVPRNTWNFTMHIGVSP